MKLHDEIYCHRDCYESHALIVCNDMLSMYTIKIEKGMDSYYFQNQTFNELNL